MRLKDQVAIVSGGGSIGPSMSNGRATSLLFAREGARVVIVDRNLAAAEETVAMITGEGGQATAIAADVTVETEVQRMVAGAVSRYGRVNILFNNVGFPLGKNIMNTSEADWDRTFAVCLKSVFLVSKHVIPEMRKVGGGVIVNNASKAALIHYDSWAYAASKAGVIKLTRDMAVEYGPENIRVNCVVPGVIDSALGRQLKGAGNEAAAKDRERLARTSIPLGRQGTPWEVAYAVLFLAGDESSYCTGISIVVDGGSAAK